MTKQRTNYADGGVTPSATKFVAADANAVSSKLNWLYETQDLPDGLTVTGLSSYTTAAITNVAGASTTSIAGGVVGADLAVTADRTGKVSLLGTTSTKLGQPLAGCYAANWCAHSDGTSGTANFPTGAWGVDFFVDGTQYVEFNCVGTYSSGYTPGLDVWIDERKISATPLSVTSGTWSANTYNTFKINFGTTGLHRVRVYMDLISLGKIWVGAAGTIWPAPANSPRWIVLGDSWSGYITNAGFGTGGWPRTMGNLLGWRDYWDAAIPGSGPNQPVGGYPNYKTRSVNDVVPSGADVVIIGTVGNDMFNSRNATQIASDITTILNTVSAMSSQPYIIVYTGTYDATSAAIDTALQPACAGKAAFISGWYGTLYDKAGNLVRTETPFITTANHATYIPGGDIHLTDTGAKYVGYRMASCVQTLLRTI
jgi:hypothetical protein